MKEIFIDLYFHNYNLAIETDENGDNDRIIDYEIKKQKAIEQELGCEFIRIDIEKGNILEFCKRYFQNCRWNIYTHQTIN